MIPRFFVVIKNCYSWKNVLVLFTYVLL
uniref:Uncharacterized protein n=1 Tax=Rhizophora mucronata TaxID=61149 RepID=A0A2P2QHU6_RHIMU